MPPALIAIGTRDAADKAAMSTLHFNNKQYPFHKQWQPINPLIQSTYENKANGCRLPLPLR